MTHYKIYVENPEKHITQYWFGNSQTIKDYLNMVTDITEKTYSSIEYILTDIYSLTSVTGIDLKDCRVCEITDLGSIIFLTIKEADSRIKKKKVFLDGSYFKDKTQSKFYFYSILDYETKKKLYEKIHMSNITHMMDEKENQEFVDGKLVFELPEQLLKDFSGKPEGFANRFSDYNMRKKGK